SATKVETGTQVTIVVTETNSGNDPISAVAVTGTNSCATFTGTATTLAVGASADFSCTFTANATLTWSATGQGTDSLGKAVPTTNETTGGTITVILPATTLTTQSVSPGTIVQSGTQVTVVVTETNSGNDAITNVSVVGSGACLAGFSGGASTLAPGASTSFSCVFTAGLGANSWTADGKATDSLLNAVPATNEHAAGIITGETSYIIVNKASK